MFSSKRQGELVAIGILFGLVPQCSMMRPYFASLFLSSLLLIFCPSELARSGTRPNPDALEWLLLVP